MGTNNKKPETNNKTSKIQRLFEDFANSITKFAGSATAFIVAFIIILIWGVTGPMFDFSQTWQIVINTTTTIVTFLMVFLIQHSQNTDSLAVHLKLDEIIKSIKKADNYLIDTENQSEEELKTLHKYYKKKDTQEKETRRNEKEKND